MIGDALCRACQWRTAMLDARDHFYHMAYLYGEKQKVADGLKDQAEVHLQNTVALEKKVKEQLALLNELVLEMKAEMGRESGESHT